jgi:hypothetical protein
MSSAFMPTRSYELFKQSIEKKKQLTCQYQGYTRTYCPYVLGHDAHGKELALALLIRSTPTGTIIGGWECVALDNVWKVQLTEGDWIAAPDGARPTCVPKVALEIEAAAA